MARIVCLVMFCTILCPIIGCRSGNDYPYNWISASISNLDNTGRDPIPVAAGAATPVQACALRLRFTRTFPQPDGSEVSAPPEPSGQFVSYSNADTINAFTLSRLDSAGPGAGSTDVTNDFRTRDPHLAASLDQFFDPHAYFSTDRRYRWSPDSLDFVLVQHARPGDSVRFVVTLALSSGTILSDTTDYVTLH